MNNQKTGREIKNRETAKARGSMLRKALSILLAAMLAITLVPLASLGAPEGNYVPFDDGSTQPEESTGDPEGDPVLEPGTPTPTPAPMPTPGPAPMPAPGPAPMPTPTPTPTPTPELGEPGTSEETGFEGITAAGLTIVGSVATVTDGVWEDFWDAWSNPAVNEIRVVDSITKTTTGTNTNRANRLPPLTRDLKVIGVGEDITISFGTADAVAANSFPLANRTVAQPTNFTLENISIVRPGTTAAIWNSGSIANTRGWNVTLANVSAPGTPTNQLFVAQGASLTMQGNVTWLSTNNFVKVNANNLALANDAKVHITASAAGTTVMNLDSSLILGDRAELTVSGGNPAIDIAGETASEVVTGSDAKITISDATNGIYLPGNPANNVNNYSRFIFGPRSEIRISVVSTALRGTGVEFQDNSLGILSATTTAGATGDTVVNLYGTRDQVPCYFNAINGAQVTITAVGGNALDVGNGSRFAEVKVTNGAHVKAYGSGTGGGADNAVIATVANSGGFTILNGGILEAHSMSTGNAYPALVQQVRGGTFKVDGQGSQLILTSRGSNSGYTATIRFRSVGDQTFDVSNGGYVEVRKFRNTSTASAAIRFGTGPNNAFKITSGGQVHIINEGNASYTSATNATGGNEAIEYAQNNFSFELSGSGPNGPSACILRADRGAAIDAYNNGGGSIKIGPGTVFVASGETGNTTYSTIHATGSGFSFEMEQPLYYDFVNTRTGGGSIFTLGGSTANPAIWTSLNSDVAVWRRGVNDIDYSPAVGGTHTLVDYSLRSTGSGFAAWGWVSGDAAFKAFWDQGPGTAAAPGFQMGSYTRISANNAPPEIRGFEPATNADKYVRWYGNVPEGLDLYGRYFWGNEEEGEVYAIVKVVKADGRTFNALATATRSFDEEELYSVETGAKELRGVLRLDKVLSEKEQVWYDINMHPFLEPGDSYEVLSYWRGNPDPTSTKRHVGTDLTFAGPIVVTDVMPPLPATNVTPSDFYANQRTLSGNWVLDPYDNPPDEVEAWLKRGSSDPVELTLTNAEVVQTSSTGGTWTFTIDPTFELMEDDEIFIVLIDENENEQPFIRTARHDRWVEAATSIIVKPISFRIDGENQILSLAEAQAITTPEELLAAIKAKGWLTVPTEVEIDIEVKSTNFPYGHPADVPREGSGYNVVVKLKDYDFDEKFFIHVFFDPFIFKDHIIDSRHITDPKDYEWSQTVTDAQLIDQGQVVGYHREWGPDGLILTEVPVEIVSRTFLLDNADNDFFTARVIVEPGAIKDTKVNIKIRGTISGILFKDNNGNGYYDTGDELLLGLEVIIEKKTGNTYSTYAPLTGSSATTDVSGTYTLIVEPGEYRIKAPNVTDYGYTYLITTARDPLQKYNDIGNLGVSGDFIVGFGTDETLNHSINAGYAKPVENPDPSAFSKKLTAIGGTATNGGPIHNSTADLTYTISYIMPDNAAGYNHVTISDIMDAGLVLKGGSLTTTNVVVTATAPGGADIPVAGSYSYVAGTGNTMVASFTFADNTDYSLLAGATITMTVVANLEQIGSPAAWPTAVTNTGLIVVNNGDIDLDDPLAASNNGRISGIVFKDDNRDGIKDTGEDTISGVTVDIKRLVGGVYEPFTPLNGSIATTGPDGVYSFEVPAGTYRLQFPTPHNGMGITTSAPHAPENGIVEGIVIELGEPLVQTRTINAGYNDVKGTITGVLFFDESKDGIFDAGVEIPLQGRTVHLYDASDLTTSLGSVNTDQDGRYTFTVDPGSYVVKAPVDTSRGFTYLIPLVDRDPLKVYSDVNNDGFSHTMTIDVSDQGAALVKTANAGYAEPVPNPNSDAFSKKLTAIGGTAVEGGPIHDSTADLTYTISYKMPANTAGYNHVEILDIMDAGLVLKEGNTANITITVVAADGVTPITGFTGTTSYAPGTVSGTNVASFKFAADTDYRLLAGATITMTIVAKLEQIGSPAAWPTAVTNTGRLIVNNGVIDERDDLEESNNGLITGIAFSDANRNGIRDAGEGIISGLPVTIKRWNGTEYVLFTPLDGSVATTGTDGAYRFEVPAGTYRLEFPTPHNGMGITTSAPDNAPESGIVDNIVIQLGTPLVQTRTIDVGYDSVSGTITGVLFLDASKDGIFDTGETPLDGKTVELYAAGNLTTLLDSTTTDLDGRYTFTVTPASYVVKAPAVSPYGFTYLIPLVERDPLKAYSDVNNDGFSGTLTILETDQGADLIKTANAGYTEPTFNPDPNAFSKKLTAIGDTAVEGGPIHDSTADLTYTISYIMPPNTAGYNHVEILDIMDAGLVLKGGDTNNITITVVAADGVTPITGLNGTESYVPGVGTNPSVASYKFAANTDYRLLAGATITMTIVANLVQVGTPAAWPTAVTNTGRLVVNNGEMGEDELDESNNGLISGIAFKDANWNGDYDPSVTNADEVLLAGVSVTIKRWNGTEYVAFTPLSGPATVTTGADGAFSFEVPAGTYRLEFPTSRDDGGVSMGITTVNPPNVGVSGVKEGIVIALGDVDAQTKQVNVGYNRPHSKPFDDIIESFSKTVDDGTGTNTFVDSRTVADVNETLLYKISFDVPEKPTNPADITNAFAGFYSIKLDDVMEEGLVFASVAAGDWNYRIMVGATEVSRGIATGSTVDFTFTAALIEQHLVNAPAGTEVSLMVRANVVQLANGMWPPTLVNTGYLTINEEEAADEELVLLAGNDPVITFLERPLVFTQTPLVNTYLTADQIKSELEVTDAEDYPTWSEATG
ncbi:MAG: isopeptide-forming domain-containing fimbrial protein, partial [Coriobacteriia bacterium]|nr:isopeptide-forming domain-containing fimbrial protein [Coriobacteriia bacterium]